MAFAAHARSDIPWLLDELARLRAQAEAGERVRAALVRSDSLLSLLRYRCEHSIRWGDVGLPTLAHVDEVIAQSRAALAPEGPEAAG